MKLWEQEKFKFKNRKKIIKILWELQHILWTQPFILRHTVIALKQVFSHRGKEIADSFFMVFEEFDLLQKIGWITTDNHSNNDTLQCCRNEHEQMNINKHGKQTKHKPTPAALFVRERSPTLVCPFNPFAPIFISFFFDGRRFR